MEELDDVRYPGEDSVLESMERQDFSEAIRKLENVDTDLIFGSKFAYYFHFAVCCYYSTRFREGLKYGKKAMQEELIPESIGISLSCATSLDNKRLVEKYLELMGDWEQYEAPAFLVTMARANSVLSRYSVAEEILQKMIDKNPYDKFAWLELGIVYSMSDNLTEAYKAFDFAIL